jgi:O-antigen/teichoic acid export membrane protein
MVIFPDLAKLWADQRYDSFLRLVKRGSLLVAALVTPLALAIIVLIPHVLCYAVGSKFLDAVEPTRILICGAWMAAVFFWTRPAVLAMDKAHIPTIVNFFNMLLVFSLSLLLVPRLGATGTALVCSTPIIFGNLLVGLCAYRNYRLVTA